MFTMVNKVKTSFYLLILLVLLIFFRAGSFDLSLKIDDYLYTGWLFNYDYGFMRRALPGEIISFLGMDSDYRTIRTIGAIILVILFYLFTYFIFKILDHLNLKEDKWIYLFSFMALPFLVSQWVLELGRFDQIIQIMQLICLLFILKNQKPYISFILINIVTILSALIHEAALIIFIPTIILIFYLQFKHTTLTIVSGVILCISLLTMIVYGKIDANHANLIIEKYKELEKFNYYAVRTTQLTNFENIITSYHTMVAHKTYIDIILCLFYLYPIICFFKKIFGGLKYFYIFIIALSPIGLSIIAFDYFRWIALAFFNLSILTFYLILSHKVDLNELSNYLVKSKRFIKVYGVISLLIGALGVVNLFPNAHNPGGLTPAELPTEILTKLNFPAATNSQVFEVSNKVYGWQIETDFSQYENVKLAKSWYENQVKLNNGAAQNNLALMYIRGGEFTIDYDKAIQLLLKSTKNNHPEAFNNLGVIYSNGLGVEKDYKKAIYYYQIAEKLGSPAAIYNMAISYKKGLNGLPKDQAKAKVYFIKAANLNYSLAQHELKDKKN